MTKPGIVYLVGAGPGDPGLITLRGLEAIRTADVIVYDRLIPQSLLKEARPEAKLIYVGKQSSNHALTQDQINEVLALEALAGHTVCRLKGGDPFIFGRGGEEALYLVEKNLSFEIIPGITSAIAAAAYAGIPVTHREFASSVAFVTGQEDTDKSESTINWAGLAKGPDTLVFLMGMANLSEIIANLIAHGRAADTPAALVRWGTTSRQQTVVGMLSDILEKARAADLKPPVAFIVGEVVKLRAQLSWFEKRPLFGQTIVVTRAREQASELTARFEKLGARVIEFPVIKSVALAPDTEFLRALPAYDWIIFTSANGVKYLMQQLRSVGRDLRALGNAKIASIGPGTTAALKSLGLKVDFQPTEFVAERVLEQFPENPAGKQILIPRALQARDVLPEGLQQKGAQVKVYPVYETLPDAEGAEEIQSSLAAGEIDVICFTSSSTVTNFLTAIGDAKITDNIAIASIGPVTTKTAEEAGLRVKIQAEEHTIDGLVKAVSKYFAEKKNENTI